MTETTIRKCAAALATFTAAEARWRNGTPTPIEIIAIAVKNPDGGDPLIYSVDPISGRLTPAYGTSMGATS